MLGSAPIVGKQGIQKDFAQIPSVHVARSSFKRDFDIKDTMEFDQLTPIFVDEILPGDDINLNVKLFARLATPIYPIMDNMRIDVEFFFVPCRLVWENWERFQGAQDNPGDSTDYLIPQVVAPAVTGFQAGTMYDHMGLPTAVPGISVNALPFRAARLIFNTWYRDQNLQNSHVIAMGDGPDAYIDYADLDISNTAHDYFTSLLPWPQKGPAVEIPASGTIPITVDASATAPGLIRKDNTHALEANAVLQSNASSQLMNSAGGGQTLIYDPNGSLEAVIGNDLQITINNFRNAMQVQSILELDARGGTRYVEALRARWNVVSPDFRLQRPEFIGGGRVDISTHPIPQTSPTSGANAMGSLAAFSTALSGPNSIGAVKSFVEHGYVIGFARARADITYQQGIRRMWSRLTRFDLAEPKLQQIGEQAVLKKELIAVGSTTPGQDDEVLGYQERHADYKFMQSEIRGQFRSNHPQSLDAWHLSRELVTPVFNSTLIESVTPIDRVIAVPSSPALLLNCWFHYTHSRELMTYSTPASLGRF